MIFYQVNEYHFIDLSKCQQIYFQDYEVSERTVNNNNLNKSLGIGTHLKAVLVFDNYENCGNEHLYGVDAEDLRDFLLENSVYMQNGRAYYPKRG